MQDFNSEPTSEEVSAFRDAATRYFPEYRQVGDFELKWDRITIKLLFSSRGSLLKIEKEPRILILPSQRVGDPRVEIPYQSWGVVYRGRHWIGIDGVLKDAKFFIEGAWYER